MKSSHRFARLVAIILIGGVVLGVCLVALGPGVSTLAASSRYSGEVAPQLKPLDFPTTLYDANGNVMDRLGNLYRSAVTLDEVPGSLQNAVIATEDRSFYSNPGIDMRAIVRAFGSNVDSGGIGQGGSTITQQLIKNRYFTNPKRDLDRKVREAVLATRLTGEWSKRRILQEYLNTVYFGVNAYGVSEAANRIIGKPLAELDLADAALLAGLIKNPSAYDPFVHPEAATLRRTEVLEGMVDAGKITQAEADFANAKALPQRQDCRAVTLDPACDELRGHTPYAEEVKNRLLQIEELGVDEQAAAQRVFAGGLKVYTAYRPDITKMAQNAIESTIGRYAPSCPNCGDGYVAGMSVIDPGNGEVLAIASSFPTAQGFNFATMSGAGGRKVGSTFKPITLAAAIQNGYSPDDTVNGSTDGRDPETGRAACAIEYLPWFKKPATDNKWYVSNASDGSSGGWNDLFYQTKESVNCAYARLFTSVGPPKVQTMAKDLGYTRPVLNNLSDSIGETPHSPLEVATVFSSFASQGLHRDPVFIRRIEDANGRVIYRAPSARRVLTVEQARTVTDVLSHVTQGTGSQAALPGDRPLAGKTGTVDDQVDAWFAGYTPQLVAAVWMGNPIYEDADLQPRASMSNVGGVRVYGGTYPARMWKAFMSAALDGQPIVQFDKPNPLLWPPPAKVNPAGGRGEPFPQAPRFPVDSTTTSSTLPVDTTTTTLPPETTTTTGAPPTSTTSTP